MTNNRLEEAYQELGRAYYEGKFEDPLPELLPLFDEITELRGQQKGQRQVNNRFCIYCGQPVTKSGKYCVKCGKVLE